MLGSLQTRSRFKYCARAFLLIISIAMIAGTTALAADEPAGKGHVEVSIAVDDRQIHAKTAQMTVSEVIDSQDIPLGPDDMVTPAEDTVVEDGTKIVIKRILRKEMTVTETVDYMTIKKQDSDLAYNETKVVQEGSEGQDKLTYEVLYSRGEEVSKKEISRTTIKKPENRIIKTGYKEKFEVRAFAYTGGGNTATGTRARVGAIAVDPDVIPLGTRVHVEGYGSAVAEDTGGAYIQGRSIDLYMNSKAACYSWGKRYVTIYIL